MREMRNVLVKDIHHLQNYPVFGSQTSQQAFVTFGSVGELMAFLRQQHPLCPHGCDSSAVTKFDYFENHMLIQPRYKCTVCKRHFTLGGTIRAKRAKKEDGGRPRKRPKKEQQQNKSRGQCLPRKMLPSSMIPSAATSGSRGCASPHRASRGASRRTARPSPSTTGQCPSQLMVRDQSLPVNACDLEGYVQDEEIFQEVEKLWCKMDLEDKGPSVEDEEKNFLKDFNVDDGDDLDLLLGLEEFSGEFSDQQGQGTRFDLGEEQNNFAMELVRQMEEEFPIPVVDEENDFAMELEREIEEASMTAKEEAMLVWKDEVRKIRNQDNLTFTTNHIGFGGFAYAAGAAIGHSCIDASRKWASQRFSDRELVALVALLDALLLSSMALLSGGFDLFSLTRLDTEYVAALLVTAAIKALVGFMYQRALHVSPLSVTVPYLAFTPVLLVFTSYVIINELPSSQGLMGIVVVTLGGYFLALDHPAEVEVKKSDEPPGKIVSVLPLLPWNSSKACDKVPKFSTDGDGVVLDLSEKNSPSVAIPGGNSSWWPQIQWEEGTLLMLGVAALLSISNSLDKMAGHLAPSLLNFAALQRGFTAVPVVLYLLVTSRRHRHPSPTPQEQQRPDQTSRSCGSSRPAPQEQCLFHCDSRYRLLRPRLRRLLR
ncbi:hypothetical protein SELMODRAFT_443479, partial [Selaginella moellendorffii]